MELERGMKFRDMDPRDPAVRVVVVVEVGTKVTVRNLQNQKVSKVKKSSFFPAGTVRRSGFVHLPTTE